MPADAIAWPFAQSEAGYTELTRKLRAMMEQINALQALVRVEEQGNGEARPALDLAGLRRGLDELEQMAGEIFYELPGGELLLTELPDVSLAEALSQLAESTAETLGLSSRVSFAGQERALSEQSTRLLYRLAQEVLARVPAHEGARRLRLSLDYRPTEITLGIEDDGVPGSAEQLFFGEPGESLPVFLASEQVEQNGSPPGQIMRRLRDMLENLGGMLAINSGVEQGVQIQAHLPYQIPEPPEPLPIPVAGQETDLADIPAKISVLVVDGQAVSRAGLRRLLESYPDLQVVGEAGDGVQAVSETAELLPRVVLMDTQSPEDQSLESLRQMRQLNAEVRVLLLADQENEALLYEALRAGASGYVLKDIAPDELAQAVRAVARGEVLVQPQQAARLLARFGGQEFDRGHHHESLTARERDVLQLLVRGLRNKEIAARLFVSERTVNFHLANIYAKLHVSGRTEALSKALEQGLLKV